MEIVRWREALVVIASLCCSSGMAQGQSRPDREVPLYNDLGDHHYEITTSSARAQAYFDQGLRLYYAFNHAEAIRSLREAQRLDPECSMCWWAEALAWGPNINLPMDSASGVSAYEALRQAEALRWGGSEKERALIEALSGRYAPIPPDDRARLDQAYADAMAGLAQRFPEDLDIKVLYAESLMDLRPWDYWDADGLPQPGIRTALDHLEAAMARDPRHPGACHFYIHAVEQVHPQRAVPCAERLAALMPGAGHIVHMPGHIYIRVGRYLDAVAANEHAVHADETYIRDQRPDVGMYTAGYYPHKYDFMAFAATMIGRSAEAISAAERVATLLPAEMFDAPGMDFLQHWSIRPLLVRVRFGRWSEILATEAPPRNRLHSRAIWHYARGRALVAGRDLAGARRELESMRAVAQAPELQDLKMEYNMSADLLEVADGVLAGWLEAAEGRFDAGVEALRGAVAAEDALLYGEPPEWTTPARQDLGAVLLLAGRPLEAEAAFREDLERFPENGWSLDGLARALRASGRAAEAEAVEADFRRVWRMADVSLGG